MATKTAAALTLAEIEHYRDILKNRQNTLDEETRLSWEKARSAAARAAHLLKNSFNASRVVLFGSVVHPELFHDRSDIDLVVWGIDERDYYRAVGALQAVDPQFSIDLILFDEVSARLQETILREGVEL